MNLKSYSYKVISIRKKTKAKWWADLEVGTIIHFHMDMKRKGGAASRGLYATSITCVNQTKQTTYVYSQTEVCNYLEKFELSTVSCIL